MNRQQVKLSFDGSVRKVMMDVGSFDLIQQSVSSVIGLKVGEFTVSYVDDDKDVISFPRTGITKDEFDAFRSVEGPVRLIIERVVKANEPSSTVKNDVAAFSASASVDAIPSAPFASTVAVGEEEEEESKKEKSLCSLIGSILSNEEIVNDVQGAIASKQVADIAALIGATLVAAGDDEGCGFTSLVPILFTQLPVLLEILQQLSEKHPEIKELVENVKQQGCYSFVHPRMYRKFFKFCKRGGFGFHNEENDEVQHCHPGHHHPGHHHHHHHPDHHHHHPGHHPHHPPHPPHHPGHHHPGHHHHHPGHCHHPHHHPGHHPHHHHPGHHHHGCHPDHHHHHPGHHPHHPPHPPHHPGHQHPRHHHHGCYDGEAFGAKPIHYGVTCDGCSSNNELKEKSINDGHFAHNRGGFIVGNRYKSTPVYNFDLCESCEASGLFQQTHGPFIKIPKRIHRNCRWNPFEQADVNVEVAAASSSLSSSSDDENDEVEQMYAQSSASSTPSSFEQKKSKKNEFENIQKQGMELFSSIMKAVNESSQPKKQDAPKDIDALAEKWKSKIELLQSLGFVEWKIYLPILEEENGDLERCIGRILALNDV